jgi:hypothetical protein
MMSLSIHSYHTCFQLPWRGRKGGFIYGVQCCRLVSMQHPLSTPPKTISTIPPISVRNIGQNNELPPPGPFCFVLCFFSW